jgi:2',3'-cyclic-nucleotide 2'-phosphodiesterase (5'-nucleotidase family)
LSASRLRFLHTNDLHGALTDCAVEQLRALRRDVDLYFDSGDCVKAGNLGVSLGGDPVWEKLHTAGCDVGTIGNRESHPLARAFRTKVAGAKHVLLCANLRDRSGHLVLSDRLTVRIGEVRVGIFGVMVPMVTRRMAAARASSYLWEDPVVSAEAVVAELRRDHDVVIGITHIGLKRDLVLAERVGGVDILFGGHSHSVLGHPIRVGSCWICQGGSHARYVGRYEYDLGSRTLTGGLRELARKSRR